MELVKTDFVGTWKSKSGSTLVVLSDGRFTYDHVPSWYVAVLPVVGAFFWEKLSGTWDLVDDSITIQPSDGVLRVWKVATINSNELKVVNENGTTVRFKR